jgi:hypothetical protein
MEEVLGALSSRVDCGFPIGTSGSIRGPDMSAIIPAIWFAGVLQLLVASANFFAPRKLQYRENLARVSPIVREVFVVQCLYIVLVLVAFAMLCFVFAKELAGASLLGRCISGFLAFFWGLRALLQVFLYNREIKREHPIYNVLFLTTYVALTVIFALAAAGSP